MGKMALCLQLSIYIVLLMFFNKNGFGIKYFEFNQDLTWFSHLQIYEIRCQCEIFPVLNLTSNKQKCWGTKDFKSPIFVFI